MDDVTAKVAKQYAEFAYPKPYDDLEAAVRGGARDGGDPSIYGPLLWPEGRPRETLDILVAGCGTQQAAQLAICNRESRVVGIDLSAASLGHERFLREKHGLSNLELFQGDLREVGKLDRQFDLIVSTGVLHHLADPSEGLAALRSVLRPGGAMQLMVYGRAGRAGVYMIQDACRRLGLEPGAEGVAAVRELLAALPVGHYFHSYARTATELAHDEAIVDTFLHPQDRAYSVPEVLEWLDDNGLGLQAWAFNHLYYPEAFVREPARSRICALPDEEQWAVVEDLLCVHGFHMFVARPKGREVRPVFKGEAWLDYRPSLRPTARLDGAVLWVNEYQMELGEAELLAVAASDGQTTITRIIDHPALAAFARPERERFGREAFERLWKIGAMMFEIPG